MQEFAGSGDQLIAEIANRHGFSVDAVSQMMDAVSAGHGRMAQFNHAEFGGAGQWMRGGMTMVSDMFNGRLKSRVERLCEDLSQVVAADEAPASTHSKSDGGDRWWPDGLGTPASQGAQDGISYAYFPSSQRLAVDDGSDRITLYDTLDHHISGVSQQQPGRKALTFSSQHGPIDLATLPQLPAGGSLRSTNVVATIEKLS